MILFHHKHIFTGKHASTVDIKRRDLKVLTTRSVF